MSPAVLDLLGHTPVPGLHQTPSHTSSGCPTVGRRNAVHDLPGVWGAVRGAVTLQLELSPNMKPVFPHLPLGTRPFPPVRAAHGPLAPVPGFPSGPRGLLRGAESQEEDQIFSGSKCVLGTWTNPVPVSRARWVPGGGQPGAQPLTSFPCTPRRTPVGRGHRGDLCPNAFLHWDGSTRPAKMENGV